jgi:hypothetical protein
MNIEQRLQNEIQQSKRWIDIEKEVVLTKEILRKELN